MSARAIQKTIIVRLEEREADDEDKSIKQQPLFDPRNPRNGEKGKEEKQKPKPTLGINAKTLTAEIARLQGLEGARGAYIASIEPDSIADEYNLIADDLIVEMNNKPIQSLEDFLKITKELKPGTDVVIRVLRRGRDALHRSWIVSFTMP